MLFLAITHLLFTHDYVVDSLIAAAPIRGRCSFHSTCIYRIAGNICGEKVGGNAKFGILAGLNLADL